MSAPPMDSLEEFADLAARFVDAAESGDLPAMDSIMAHRRRILGRIAAPIGGDERQTAAEAGRRRELLEAILDMDRRAGAFIAEHRDETGRNLASLEEGRRGLGGYRSAVARTAKWIDARG